MECDQEENRTSALPIARVKISLVRRSPRALLAIAGDVRAIVNQSSILSLTLK